jgi:hypothetical protein
MRCQPGCVSTIRAAVSSVVPTPSGRWRRLIGWAVAVGRRDCAAGKRSAATSVVIHIIAEQATIDGSGSAPASEMGADGLIPPELAAELAKSAKLVPLVHPADAPPEPGYAPSKALAEFVRCRDLTCRWPGCDRPALDCDLDHTTPYADGGPTHASNLGTLHLPAYESRSPAPILGHAAAAEAVHRIEYEWVRMRRAMRPGSNQYLVAMRAEQLDDWSTDFLRRPQTPSCCTSGAAWTPGRSGWIRRKPCSDSTSINRT